jgi:hypothetical protein
MFYCSTPSALSLYCGRFLVVYTGTCMKASMAVIAHIYGPTILEDSDICQTLRRVLFI